MNVKSAEGTDGLNGPPAETCHSGHLLGHYDKVRQRFQPLLRRENAGCMSERVSGRETFLERHSGTRRQGRR